MLLETHLHQEGLVRAEDLEDGRIVAQERMKHFDGVSCEYGILL